LADDPKPDPDVMSTVIQVNRLLEQTPGAGPILDALRSGQMDPHEATMKLAALALDAGHGDDLLAAWSSIADAYEEESAPVVMQHDNGREMINPLMSAAIKERASLDGDVPEARFGPLPEGGHPAVPVITDALDPVVVGYQLEQASEIVADRLALATDDHMRLVNRALEQVEQSTANLPAPARDSALESAKSKLPPVPTGVPGYEAGKAPAPLAVPEPDTTTMARMPAEDRRRLTYRTISTTQGRESVTPGIHKTLVAALKIAGLDVAEGDPDEGHTEAVRAEWTTVLWGPEDMADQFDPISTAVKALASDLCFAFDDGPDRIWIRVTPYHDGVADRRFGWSVCASPQPKTNKTK